MQNKKLFFWALTSALAGFLFGFDTVVISGAEQTLQKLWGLNSTLHVKRPVHWVCRDVDFVVASGTGSAYLVVTGPDH